ncbi:hypothetical protein M405DRAFT_832687, partial [Rhizopogon salebrosus TDB-379]
GVSEVLACRTIYRAWTTQESILRFKLSPFHHHYRPPSVQLFILCIARAPGGHFKPFPIDVMLRDKTKSGGSTKQGKLKGVALIDSPTRIAPLTSAKDPPPYGAQRRQDALWAGE